FRSRFDITALEQRIGAAGTSWRKGEAEATPAHTPATPDAGKSHAPLAPAVQTEACDLSVVIVFYNMRREAARSLHALSRVYQQGVTGLDYEVIVVENGSDPEQRLGEEFVRGFGPEFRYVDIGDDATP